MPYNKVALTATMQGIIRIKTNGDTMTHPQQTMLQCSNCGTPNPVTLRRVIDVQKDSQGKNLLLNGRVNTFRCQNCETMNTVSSPLLYHDASKELLIAFVPMDVALKQKVNEEKIIGDLMNELTSSLEKEAFRAYMFNPKRALTLQGVIEQVIEADGITKDMIADQKQRVELLQTFLKAESEEAVVELVKKHDADIDMGLFQTLSLMGERVMQDGQQQLGGHLMAIQQVMLEHSTFGQKITAQQQAQDSAIQEVAQRLEKLGESARRADIIDLAIDYGDDDAKLQALVGLARTALDYQFFLEFSERISKKPADEREKLEAIRDMLRELSEQVDEQTRSVVQQKTQLLRSMLDAEDFEPLLRQNLEMIDDNFMGVLAANMQEAKRRQDDVTLAKMTQIYDKAVEILQSQMTPELRYINDLLSAESPEAMQTLINEKASDYDDLLDVVDAVEELFEAQGQADGIERLEIIRAALEKSLS
ncbi:MAG: CpXC domain-containing protein [Anaerolineae bacterium]|nr:CpXC domain-containing protein [Anaerolineae bacterium]